ncbi:hypothetical protein C3F42_01810 [Pseudomonas sp. PONIH3]|nr:hypothetical protein C3F42_01810 [Pseudomonas sp. PONIH3]
MVVLPLMGCLGRGSFISDTKHNIKQYLMYQIRFVYRFRMSWPGVAAGLPRDNVRPGEKKPRNLAGAFQ